MKNNVFLKGSGATNNFEINANAMNIPFGAGIASHSFNLPPSQENSISTLQSQVAQFSSQSNVYPNLNQSAPFSYLYPSQMPNFVNSTRDYMHKVNESTQKRRHHRFQINTLLNIFRVHQQFCQKQTLILKMMLQT